MKRFIAWALSLLLAVAPAAAQMTATGIGGGGFGAAVATTTTLNPSDKAAAVALSGGNLIMTNTGAGSARSIANHTSGKYYVEMTVGSGNNDYDHALSIANASASLTGGPGSPDANSTALYKGDPAIYVAGSASGVSDGTYVTTDVIGMAVDLDNHRIWYRVNGGNWNGSGTPNPATNTGGADISAITGAIYVMAYSANNTNVNTMNFGATAYGTAAPAGFGNW